EFKTISARVLKDSRQYQQAKALNDLPASLLAEYDVAQPAAFDKAVKTAGVSVKYQAPASKEDAIARYGRLTGEALFGLDPNDGIVSFQDDKAIKLVRLTKIVNSTDKPDAKALTSTRNDLRTQMLQEIQQQFMQAWQTQTR